MLTSIFYGTNGGGNASLISALFYDLKHFMKNPFSSESLEMIPFLSSCALWFATLQVMLLATV